MDATQLMELLGFLEELYNDGTYSDLTIICDGTKYRVHKAIICPRSAFFATACSGNFQEARTGIVQLPDDDPLAVRMMVHYFYHLDYPHVALGDEQTVTDNNNEKSASEGGFKDRDAKKEHPLTVRPSPSPAPHCLTTNLSLHVKVYALAEKYSLAGLKSLALTKFKEETDIHWESDDLLLAAEEAYASTVDSDRGLRDAVVRAIYTHTSLLRKKECQATIRRVENLAYDLLMYKLRNSPDQHHWGFMAS